MSRSSFKKASFAFLPIAMASLALSVACAPKDGGKKSIEKSVRTKAEKEEQIKKLVSEAFPNYKKDEKRNLEMAATVARAEALVVSPTDVADDKALHEVHLNFSVAGVESDIVAEGQVATNKSVQLKAQAGTDDKRFKFMVRCSAKQCEKLAVLLTEVKEDQTSRDVAMIFIRRLKDSADAKAAAEQGLDENALKLIWIANSKENSWETNTDLVPTAKADPNKDKESQSGTGTGTGTGAAANEKMALKAQLKASAGDLGNALSQVEKTVSSIDESVKKAEADAKRAEVDTKNAEAAKQDIVAAKSAAEKAKTAAAAAKSLVAGARSKLNQANKDMSQSGKLADVQAALSNVQASLDSATSAIADVTKAVTDAKAAADEAKKKVDADAKTKEDAAAKKKAEEQAAADKAKQEALAKEAALKSGNVGSAK